MMSASDEDEGVCFCFRFIATLSMASPLFSMRRYAAIRAFAFSGLPYAAIMQAEILRCKAQNVVARRPLFFFSLAATPFPPPLLPPRRLPPPVQRAAILR